MLELVFTAPAAVLDAACDVLTDELGALSVSVEDADAGTAVEKPVFGEPGSELDEAAWERSVVTALFTDAPTAERAAARVLASFGPSGANVDAIRPVDDEGWVRKSQAQFESTRIADDFWVVPSWREPPADAAHVIRLDPGLAFGTGTHPTTRMCLRWIAKQAAGGHGAWPRVLDYGCGSGILAIGAASFGAGRTDAVDIDPAAVEATRANVAANGVSVQVGFPDMAEGRYSLVLANILATPLKLLAPLLFEHLEPGADLVLAGILERQAGELAEAYAPWLAISVADVEEGWILMTGKRP
jgi:ribosomal protein L11 methyltransferase